jgi:hypothetical protein
MNDLHQKYPTDPAAFKAAADAWKAKYLEEHGGGEVGQALSSRPTSCRPSTATRSRTPRPISTSPTSRSRSTPTSPTRRTPAGPRAPARRHRHAGVQAAVERMEASYQALGTNPLFKMPQEQIDLELKNFKSLLQGEALVAHIDETFTKKGKGDAQKALTEGILPTRT